MCIRDRDYETDVVVVGYGGAGMWSSLVAADEGGSEVVILEKAPVEGGGNSRINNGEWTVIKDEKLFRDYCVAFGHEMCIRDRIGCASLFSTSDGHLQTP